MGLTRWDWRGLELAELVAGWSKDPSTQVGAAILRADNTVASVGFNGLPRGISDDHRLHEREWKHAVVRHAEENAIQQAHERLDGCTLYVAPLWPCSRCAGAIIQAGIARLVYRADCSRDDWSPNARIALALLNEGGVEIVDSQEAQP